ncbi:hypothetical protein GUJ93_ZPchr0001g32250 [Zizania palustris]|uniref:Uncharacterized protein n=1 Tax=Zizania palustris TaxID=103762 RepID=A0A8J5VLM3_ZIZPA|nr:hypothetical protein GUJ93_ZPchr0001g32250 [Zizania palustris]
MIQRAMRTNGGGQKENFLEVGDGVFEVLSASGDTHLGGDDFDKDGFITERLSRWPRRQSPALGSGRLRATIKRVDDADEASAAFDLLGNWNICDHHIHAELVFMAVQPNIISAIAAKYITIENVTMKKVKLPIRFSRGADDHSVDSVHRCWRQCTA